MLILGRAMHHKLSSPDRRKPSPAEAKKKQEERHDIAARNREALEEARRRRVGEAAARLQQVKDRQEELQMLSSGRLAKKLSESEERHAQHIQAIARKAENENTKVEEVLFINGLTADHIKLTLRCRLNEVEERIKAGRLRREEIFETKRARQKKREREKAAQMSERRLIHEREAEDRWERLQGRIEAVGRRRKARLDELKKMWRVKCEEKAISSSSSSSSSSKPDELSHGVSNRSTSSTSSKSRSANTNTSNGIGGATLTRHRRSRSQK